jgi:hypothetical protein
MSIRSTLGAVGAVMGELASPVTFGGSLVRRARLFHPSGLVYAGSVLPASVLPPAGPLHNLAAALGVGSAGKVVARLSGALWKNSLTLPDSLGIGLRFRGGLLPVTDPAAHPTDQDLLFETFSHLYTLPLAPFTTNVNNFFANEYYAVLPFEAPGIGVSKFRIQPVPHVAVGSNRDQILNNAVLSPTHALFHLYIMPPGMTAWTELLRFELLPLPNLMAISGYQQALGFTPFHDGKGIVPTGYFNGMRAATYLASKLGRNAVGG